MSAIRFSISVLLMTSLAASVMAGTYTAGGTFVVKTGLGTLLDNGGVVCEGADGDGVGGGCLIFPTDGRGKGFVQVNDDVAGHNVAFQVCIDNNGDGICGGPQTDPACFDQIYFNHDDAGRFFNPLGPLPTTFLEGCAGGFPGYVVLLCQGVHAPERFNGHTHPLTTGTIALADVGDGFGDFCGGGATNGTSGNNPAIAKAYSVI